MEGNVERQIEFIRQINDLLPSKRRLRSGPSIQLRHMTITELRNTAEGLAKRANRVVAGRKQDSINRGWLAIERLYGYAKDALPKTAIRLALKDEPETWANIARLAGAIVNACNRVEPPAPDEIPTNH